AIITLVNAIMVWLAASGDYPASEAVVHRPAEVHGAMPAPSYGEIRPLGDVQPEHAAAPGFEPTIPESRVMPEARPGPSAPAVMAPHGVELRPMAEPGGLPPALETPKSGH
ncbi:MAG: hypothetical protein R3310_07345, partial [Candidatus Competibacteraceae bacterium]|nr:hypothetical protein [Candidatus Competibacteraceae bacterium]